MRTYRSEFGCGLLAGALAALALAAGSDVSAQWPRGSYLSMDVGLSQGAPTESTLSGPN